MVFANNKRAFHNYHVEDKFEAGLVLLGWEVKAIRAARAQLKESYVHWRDGAFYLVGCHISALPEASTHFRIESTRPRKLLLNKREMKKLKDSVERSGYTIVPLDLHAKGGRVKLNVGLAKGKKLYDKRAALKEKEWKREQDRLMKRG